MGIIYDLWETQKPPQKKILGVGYSSTYLTNEDKNTLSYKLWMKIMSKCFSQSEYQKKKRNGKKYECCNSWLDYQKFSKWFKDNYKECDSYSLAMSAIKICDFWFYSANSFYFKRIINSKVTDLSFD